MDLYQLRTFVVTAELGNLTQAAEHLHLSQPAASAQIKSLEEEFGIELFERKRTGLSLTRDGAFLLPKVQHLLANATDVVAQAKNLRGQAIGTIKLATVPAAFDKSFLRLGEILSRVAAQHPQLAIQVYHRNSRTVAAEVASGEFDAGLAFGNRELPNVRRVLLQSLTYRIVAPANWDARLRKASWSELASLPWIVCAQGGTRHDMMTQMFNRVGLQPTKVIESDSEQVIAGLVTAGAGLGLMRDDLAIEAETAGRVFIVEKGTPTTYLQFLYRASIERDRAVRVILDVLHQLWPEAQSASKETVESER
jgi:DNA-binding transcriptional LysR family regulator